MTEDLEYSQYKLLDRTGPRSFLGRRANPQLETLQQIVDYGVPLLQRCLRESERKAEDVVLLSVLLRQAIAMGDAVHLQLKNGAIYTASLPLRSLFEARLSIEWILTQGKERWGRQYYVSELRKRLEANKMAMTGTEEAEKFRDLLGEKYGEIFAKLKQDEMQEQIAGDIESIEEKLASDIYRDINQDFENHWKRKERGWKPRWHEPGDGPGSIRAMARELGHESNYEVLYTQWSETSHGARARPHIKITDEGLMVEPIRTVKDFRTVFQMTIIFLMFDAYQMLLKTYRPDELDRLRQKYKDQWRKAYVECPRFRINIQYE